MDIFLKFPFRLTVEVKPVHAGRNTEWGGEEALHHTLSFQLKQATLPKGTLSPWWFHLPASSAPQLPTLLSFLQPFPNDQVFRVLWVKVFGLFENRTLKATPKATNSAALHSWTRNPTSYSNVIASPWQSAESPMSSPTHAGAVKGGLVLVLFTLSSLLCKSVSSHRALDRAYVPYFCLPKLHKDENDLMNKSFLFIKTFSRGGKKKKRHLTYPSLRGLTQKF